MMSSVLSACSGLGVMMEGQMVHGLLVKLGIDIDTRVCNSLLSMYFKFNNLEESQRKILVRDTNRFHFFKNGSCSLW